MCGYPEGVFNIGPGEIIIVALVLLIAVGPEQLPGVIRRAGRAVSQARSMTEGLRSDFMAGMDEIERATDPNAWAASAGPTEGSKPEKKHTATMADAPAADEPTDDTSTDSDSTDDESTDDNSADSETTQDSETAQDSAAAKDPVAESANGATAAKPATSANGNGAGTDSSEDTADAVPVVDGDDDGTEAS